MVLTIMHLYQYTYLWTLTSTMCIRRRFLQTMPANQTTQLDNFDGSNLSVNQATEPNVIYQIQTSDGAAHPHTLPIGTQQNPSLVSTPVAEYANLPTTNVAGEMLTDLSMSQQSGPLTYSEVIKLNPIPPTPGNSIVSNILSHHNVY